MRFTSLVLLVACSGGDPEPQGSSSTPTSVEIPSYGERGPWAVGTAEVDVTGTDGLVLPTQIWYPATAEGDATVVYDGLLAGDAYEGVPADCGATHPLLAFSHGSGGVRWQSPFFTEFLASHGYLVIAPDHVGNTFEDPAPDYAELAVRRPQDIRDVVDWLFAAAADSASPYAGCVDPTAGYAISGHSFGGYTTLALAGATVNDPFGSGPLDLGDDRVWAAVGLAPWDGAGAITDGGQDIGVPTMILTGELDQTTPIAQVRTLWNPMTVKPRFLGVFADAGHYSFSPVACLLETGDGCGDGFIDADAFTALVDTAAASFLEQARGLDGAIDQLPQDPEIDWTAKP